MVLAPGRAFSLPSCHSLLLAPGLDLLVLVAAVVPFFFSSAGGCQDGLSERGESRGEGIGSLVCEGIAFLQHVCVGFAYHISTPGWAV